MRGGHVGKHNRLAPREAKNGNKKIPLTAEIDDTGDV